MATVQLSVRMPSEIKARLDEEARLEERSASDVIEAALDHYLSAKEHKRRALEEAVAEADRGVFVSGEAVERWILSWDTENELPEPEPDIFPLK